ncbi:hypothetical protein CLCR_05269 [Cladophialophora carrionii]|uniref:Uncharacterized protein n=1 Tax=Cladophialophora carrionii TaxID=86049 RepID=A0A1C1CKB2_9EURO|nr:hypothetical protein CLCR_05269 [Cladophialophora carrionii]
MQFVVLGMSMSPSGSPLTLTDLSPSRLHYETGNPLKSWRLEAGGGATYSYITRMARPVLGNGLGDEGSCAIDDLLQEATILRPASTFPHNSSKMKLYQARAGRPRPGPALQYLD